VNTHVCPACGAANIVKNGKRNGKQSYRCKDCKRQFVENPTNKIVDCRTREIVGQLLKERISLRAICRACDVSMPWLLWYASTLHKNVPPDIGCKNLENLKKEDLDLEIDELCTFVGNKKRKVWVWIAQHRKTRPIVAFEVGDRGEETCTKLWNKIPEKLKQNGLFYTDLYQAYQRVIPENAHCPQKNKAQTNHIERFNATLRARLSRLVRRSYSFAKSCAALAGSLAYFIWDFNRSLTA